MYLLSEALKLFHAIFVQNIAQKYFYQSFSIFMIMIRGVQNLNYELAYRICSFGIWSKLETTHILKFKHLIHKHAIYDEETSQSINPISAVHI